MLKQDTGQIRISEIQPDFSLNGRVEVNKGKGGRLGFSSGRGDACRTHTLEMVGAAYISFGSTCTCSILVMFLVTLIICSEMMKFVIVCVNKLVPDLNEYSFQN